MRNQICRGGIKGKRERGTGPIKGRGKWFRLAIIATGYFLLAGKIGRAHV